MTDDGSTPAQRIVIDAEELVDVLFSNTELGIAIADAQGRFVRINGAFSAILGFAPDDLLNLPIWKVLPAPAQTYAEQTYTDYLNRRTDSIPNEWDAVNRQGDPIRLLVTIGRLTFGAGTLAVLTVADITASVLQAQALRESEERLRLTVAASGDGIFDWDATADRLYLSDQMRAMLGAPQLSGSGVEAYMQLVHPSDRQRAMRAVRAFVETAPSQDNVYRLRHTAGHYLRVAVRGRVQRDDNGQPKRLVGSVADITQLHRLRDDLLRAERIGRTGHWTVSLDISQPQPVVGVVWSAETFRIFRQDPTRFVPTFDGTMAFIHPDDRMLARTAVRATIENQQPLELGVRLLIDGELIHVRMEGELDVDDQGQARTLFGTVADITELVEQQQQLRQAQKLEVVGQLAGGVAHDFNNLLGVVMANLELLQLSALSAEQNARVQHALEAVERASDLTARLLSFSRKQVLNPVELEAATVVNTVVPLLQRVLPSTISLQTRIGATVRFRADRSQLESCLINLVVNARDALVDADVPFGRIDVGTYSEGPFGPVFFTVTDNGPGIAPQIIDRVCEPFFSTKQPGRGSGLGLSMVLGFAQQSGGSFKLTDRPGGGTIATIRLPGLQPDTPARFSRNDAIATPSNHRPERVLVVDDNDELRQVIEDLLTRLGHSVVTAANVEEALPIVARDIPTVLLTDLVMPGNANGLDLLRRVRRSHPQVIGILMTGYTDDHRDIVARERDVVLLQKPFGYNELLEAMQAARGQAATG